MNWEQKKEYKKKATARRSELLEKMSAPGLSRLEMDIMELEMMELNIMPDSKAWRWGHKGVLKRARKALEEKLKDENHQSKG